ncbi:hypothetical protein J7E32_04905 [Bacillus sp. ISL-55]|nr:hypothetical protein [Bacillus sp. ISL-55]
MKCRRALIRPDKHVKGLPVKISSGYRNISGKELELDTARSEQEFSYYFFKGAETLWELDGAYFG